LSSPSSVEGVVQSRFLDRETTEPLGFRSHRQEFPDNRKSNAVVVELARRSARIGCDGTFRRLRVSKITREG
jgi:hypothetical protein